ncbi:glutathione S-transferase, partial [Phenoliferia sp. Uapishka_3]
MTSGGLPTLHHLNNSQSQRVLWLLEELEVPYTLVTHIRDPVTHRSPPSLHEATPLGKAPTLVTADGVSIIECSAIMAYLLKTYDTSRKFQGVGLIGHDPFLRDEVLTSYTSASVSPFTIALIFIHWGILSDNSAGKVVEPTLASMYEFLEAQLGEQDYFMGTTPGRPDFMLSWEVDFAVQNGWVELGPKLKAWRERILASSGWKRAMEKPGLPYDLTSFKKR